MNADDFPTSPAKRQRTASPEENKVDTHLPTFESTSTHATESTSNAPLERQHDLPAQELASTAVITHGQSELPDAASQDPSSNSLLDALMLQVEAESSSDPPTIVEDPVLVPDELVRDEEVEQRNGRDVSAAKEEAVISLETVPIGVMDEFQQMDTVTGTIIPGLVGDPDETTEPTVEDVVKGPSLTGSNPMDINPMETTVIPGLVNNLHETTAIPTGGDTPAVVADAVHAISTDNTLVSGLVDTLHETADVVSVPMVENAPALGDLSTMDAVATEEPMPLPGLGGLLNEIVDVASVSIAEQAPRPMDPQAMDAIPSDNTLAPEVINGTEWEVDSSPYDSSSDSDSSSDDSSSEEDSDEDADGDYAMLDPEEAARILMQGDGGSDDEGEGSRKKEGGQLRTANERFEVVIPKPDIVVTEDMMIEELGNVEFVVESTVVIKAKTSGEYRVLEAGSLICLNDRSVVGVVADLIGRVEEPRYTIRFTNDDDIKAAGLFEPGTAAYYVPDHSTYVFTLPLKAFKGSDASNFHDEEVGAEEMEFSDDEAEAEHKRQMKAKRQGRTLENTGRGGRGGSKFPRASHRGGGRGRGGHHTAPSSNNAEGSAYGSGSLEMNYDDVPMPDANDDGYTPLQRPADLTDMINGGEQPQERGGPSYMPPPPPSHSNGGDFGGRGRGKGFGQNRGGKGGSRPYRGRGGFNQPRGTHFGQQNASNHHQNGYQPQNGYASQHSSTAPPLPNINLPTTPSITPHNIAYPPMTPSPITPLPNVSFNFGGGFQPPPNFPAFPPPPGFPGLPPPPPFAQNFNYPQQHQQTAQYQPQHQQSYAANNSTGGGQANFQSGPWAHNPALAAALQRHNEEQRRAQGQ